MKKFSLIAVSVLLVSLFMFTACDKPSNSDGDDSIITAIFEVIPDEYGDLDTRVDSIISSLQSVLVSNGYTESTVTKGTSSNGNIAIRVEVPDVEDPERVLKLIGRPAALEFKGEDSATAEALIVGHKHLESAYVKIDDNGQYVVGLKFNEEGTKKFAEVTQEYLNKAVYIYIDGERYTQINVNSQISNGDAIITSGQPGGYTYQEAFDFATRLHSGTFGVSIIYTEIREKE